MTKMRIAIGAAALTVFAPAVVFAAHVSQCCGDVLCCLSHLGCC
jgi:hypothetical protein